MFKSREEVIRFFETICMSIVVLSAIAACACEITVQHVLFGNYLVIQKIITTVIFAAGLIVFLIISVGSVIAHNEIMESVCEVFGYEYEEAES